ncbi:MAG: sensor histidine kinase N-terminal domain-containing protein [Burkholderiales bacterium]
MIASAIAQYYLSVRPAGGTFDQALSDAAVALSQALENENGRIRFALSEETARLLRSDSTDDIYFAVRGPNGELIAGDRDLPASIGAMQMNQSRVYDDNFNQQKVRVAAISTDCGNSRCQIQVAETLNKRQALTNDILLGTLMPQLVLGCLAFALIWLGIGRALSPLARLSLIIDQRSPRDLGPIEESATPQETRSLVTALNALFEKLRQSGLAQQRFIATAAHQLRTPLAGLKAEAELALLESPLPEMRHMLEHINQSAARASRLATQLLALARSEPDAHLVDPITTVDLKTLVEEHVDEWVRMAAPKNIDLGFELRAAITNGKAILLRELMRNLVHNALEYSPANAKVTLRCGAIAGNCFFEVEDSGSGIPAEYRQKAFEPFFRLPGTSGTGSGLGLAIAKEVTLAHEGDIEISAAPGGKGALLRVSFPSNARVN